MGAALVRANDWKPVGIGGLEPAALAAVKATGNTLVTAGPGAGKTELLGQRGVFLLQTGICPYPRRILAISFKRDAARNLKERFERRCTEDQAARLDSLTFDAFAKQLFDRFWRSLPGDMRPNGSYRLVFSPPRQEVQEFKRWVADNLSSAGTAANRANTAVGSVVTPGHVMPVSDTEFAAGMQHLNLSPLSLDNMGAFLQLARLYWALEQNPPLLTFQMIGRLLQLIIATSPRIMRALQATYSHLFMDEFQDTTYVQYQLMRSIFGGSATVVTAVGDDKQKIMGWAGAHANAFQQFEQDFLQGGAAAGQAHVELASNYRSNARIVEVLNVLKSRLAPNEPDFQAIRPAPPLPPEQVCGIVTSPNGDTEATGVAEYVRNRIASGTDHRGVALLVRQKAADWEKRLAPEFAKLGVGLRNEDRSLGGATIQDLMTEPYAQVVADALEYLSSRRGGATWIRLVDALVAVEGIEDDEVARTSRVIEPLDEFKKVHAMDGNVGASDADLRATINAIEAFIGLDRLRGLAPQYQQGDFFDAVRQATLGFLAECIQGRSWVQALAWYRGDNQVPLLTITKSKGLEYDTVILLGLDDNQWWSFAGNPVEGHANFFVAASRAKDRLFLMFSQDQQTRKIQEIYDLLATGNVAMVSVTDWVAASA
jgi:superfamily I DNA/RNA helicase